MATAEILSRIAAELALFAGIPAAPKRYSVDRLQLTAWALLRSQQAGIAPSPSLASGGTLGASQAGARLSYNFTRQIAATVRTTSEVGRRGGEIAGGIRIQPARGVPPVADRRAPAAAGQRRRRAQRLRHVLRKRGL